MNEEKPFLFLIKLGIEFFLTIRADQMTDIFPGLGLDKYFKRLPGTLVVPYSFTGTAEGQNSL